MSSEAAAVSREAPTSSSSSFSFMKRMFRFVDGCDISVTFDGTGKVVPVKNQQNEVVRLAHFSGDEVVRGSVLLNPRQREYTHQGVEIELRGIVSAEHPLETDYATAGAVGHTAATVSSNAVFLTQRKAYSEGSLHQATRFPFEFGGLKEFESYYGRTFQVTYMLHVKVLRPLKHVSHKEYIFVSRLDPAYSEAAVPRPLDGLARLLQGWEAARQSTVSPIMMAVKDVLHVEFRLWPRECDVDGDVEGTLRFKKVDCEIRSASIALLREEFVISYTLFSDDSTTSFRSACEGNAKRKTLRTIDLIDGSPQVDDVISFRLPLASIPDLTPTYSNIYGNRARLRYFIGVTFVTEEGKNYVKQEELTLYRLPGQRIGAAPGDTAAESTK